MPHKLNEVLQFSKQCASHMMQECPYYKRGKCGKIFKKWLRIRLREINKNKKWQKKKCRLKSILLTKQQLR